MQPSGNQQPIVASHPPIEEQSGGQIPTFDEEIKLMKSKRIQKVAIGFLILQFFGLCIQFREIFWPTGSPWYYDKEHGGSPLAGIFVWLGPAVGGVCLGILWKSTEFDKISERIFAVSFLFVYGFFFLGVIQIISWEVALALTILFTVGLIMDKLGLDSGDTGPIMQVGGASYSSTSKTVSPVSSSPQMSKIKTYSCSCGHAFIADTGTISWKTAQCPKCGKTCWPVN